MKSKISFFDKAVLKRNFKQYWPLWGGYLFLMMWLIPGVLTINYDMSFQTEYDTRRLDMMEYILDFCTDAGVFIALFFGFAAALSMFAYLHKERSCYFYHSLPITRERLFATDYISGYAMMFIPNIITAACTMISTGTKGYSSPKETLQSFLILSVLELFFYSFAVLCIVMTGQKIFSFILYCIFMGYVPGIMLLLNDISAEMFFGLTTGDIWLPEGVLEILNPIRFCLDLRIEPLWSEDYTIKYAYNLVPEDWYIILELFICALILTAIALILHKFRKSETAGDLICYKYAKPLFAWGFGISFGVLITDFLINSLYSGYCGTTAMKFITAVNLIIMCTIGYIIAQMLLNKTFRIFTTLKKNLTVYGIVVCVLSVFFVLDVTDVSGYIPAPNELAYVNLFTDDGEVYYYSDKSEKSDLEIRYITEIHRAILNNCADVKGGNSRIDNYDNYQYIRFTYTTKSGIDVRRSYYVPYDNTELTDMIAQYKYEHRVEYIFSGAEAKDISGAYLTYRTEDGIYVEKKLHGYQAKELFEATKSDIINDRLSVEYARGLKSYAYSYDESYQHKLTDEDDFTYMEYIYYGEAQDTGMMESFISYGHPLHVSFYSDSSYQYYYLPEINYHDGCTDMISCIGRLIGFETPDNILN